MDIVTPVHRTVWLVETAAVPRFVLVGRIIGWTSSPLAGTGLGCTESATGKVIG